MTLVTPLKSVLPYHAGAACLVDERRVLVFAEGNMYAPTVLLPSKPVLQRLADLQRQGLIAWSGRRLKPIPPVAKVRGESTVADLIIRERG